MGEFVCLAITIIDGLEFGMENQFYSYDSGYQLLGSIKTLVLTINLDLKTYPFPI